MKIKRKFHELENRIGMRKLLQAKREDPQIWIEIMETADNAFLYRAELVHYLKTQGRNILTLQDDLIREVMSIGPIIIGSTAMVSTTVINRYYGSPIDEFFLATFSCLGAGFSSIPFFINKLNLDRPRLYSNIREEALENIAQKRYWNSYSEGGAD